MDEYLTEMAEILEEDQVGADDELESFESWDSLAALSVLAMADSKYGVTLTSDEVGEVKTVGELYALINGKKSA